MLIISLMVYYLLYSHKVHHASLLPDYKYNAVTVKIHRA